MPSSSFGCGHRQLKVHLINFSQRGLQSQQFTRFRTSLPFSLRLFHLSHSRTTSLQSVSLFLGVMRHMWQSATCANHFHRGTKQFPTQLQHHWIRLMPEKRQGLLTCLLSMSEHIRGKRGNTLAKQNNAQSVAKLTQTFEPSTKWKRLAGGQRRTLQEIILRDSGRADMFDFGTKACNRQNCARMVQYVLETAQSECEQWRATRRNAPT